MYWMPSFWTVQYALSVLVDCSQSTCRQTLRAFRQVQTWLKMNVSRVLKEVSLSPNLATNSPLWTSTSTPTTGSKEVFGDNSYSSHINPTYTTGNQVCRKVTCVHRPVPVTVIKNLLVVCATSIPQSLCVHVNHPNFSQPYINLSTRIASHLVTKYYWKVVCTC